MQHNVWDDTKAEELSDDYPQREEFAHFRTELQEKLVEINASFSSLIKPGTDGICGKVKDLLTEINIPVPKNNNFTIGRLVKHDSLEQNQNDDEELEDEGSGPRLYREQETNTCCNTENGKKIKHLSPFFTVVNGEDSGDTRYEEMSRATMYKKKNVSLVSLEKKIEKRNDFLNKFGKTYTITNLS